MSCNRSDLLAEYRTARYCEAREQHNKGKTAHQLVQECEPLDIERVDRIFKERRLAAAQKWDAENL